MVFIASINRFTDFLKGKLMKVQNIATNNYQNQTNFKAIYIKPAIERSSTNYFKLRDFINVLTNGAAEERKSSSIVSKYMNAESFRDYMKLLTKEKGLDDPHGVQDIFYDSNDITIMRRAGKKVDKAVLKGNDEQIDLAYLSYFKQAVKIAKTAVEVTTEQLDKAMSKLEQAKTDALTDLNLI